MLIHTRLQSTLEEMSDSTSHEDLWPKLFSYMSFCDIHALVYHHLPPPGAIDYQNKFVVKKQIKTTNDNQVEFANCVFNSTLRNGARSMDDVKYWSYTPETAKDIMIANDGVSTLTLTETISGVTFPVHGPRGRNGCFSLVYGELNGLKVEQTMRLLKWACQNAHQLFCKLYLSNSKSIPTLTERETEILSWVARGKSNSVIAQILGISPHTVNTYMRRLFLKLGTSDRTSVSLIGISNGLIDI